MHLPGSRVESGQVDGLLGELGEVEERRPIRLIANRGEIVYRSGLSRVQINRPRFRGQRRLADLEETDQVSLADALRQLPALFLRLLRIFQVQLEKRPN